MVTLSQPLLPASRLETELRGTSGLSWCSFTNCSSEINYPGMILSIGSTTMQ